MIASLPMYDHPAIAPGWDALWSAVRASLAAAGFDAPDRLERGRDLEAQWRDPALLLGQSCGLPYRAGLHRHVHLLGAFDFGLPNTNAGYYRSVFVARANDARDWPNGFAQATLAYNDPLSHSGWYAATTAPFRFTVGPRTGSHVASARAVADGEADIAAIDAVTWRLLSRFDPVAGALKVVALSGTAPGLPLITAQPGLVADLRAALREGIAALADPLRADLGLRSFVELPESAYLGISIPPAPEAYARSKG